MNILHFTPVSRKQIIESKVVFALSLTLVPDPQTRSGWLLEVSLSHPP